VLLTQRGYQTAMRRGGLIEGVKGDKIGENNLMSVSSTEK
jgi:hypothetical protein